MIVGVRTFLNPRAAYETSTFMIVGVRTSLNHRAVHETLTAYEAWGGFGFFGGRFAAASEAKPERIALMNVGVRTFLSPRAAYETSTCLILCLRCVRFFITGLAYEINTFQCKMGCVRT